MAVTVEKNDILYYLSHRGAIGVSQEPVPTISIVPEGEGAKRPYLALITGLGGKYGIKRMFLNPYLKAKDIIEGAIIEMRTCDPNVSEEIARREQQRIFFEVKSEMFHAFATTIGIVSLKSSFPSEADDDSGYVREPELESDDPYETWDYEPQWDYSDHD